MMDDFDKNMQVIAGADSQQNQELQLSDADKKKLSEQYFKLFLNLTYTNWLRGKTLGQAWYTALSQLEQFIKNKKSHNPASLYLRQIFAAHKTKWAQVMMTNKHRDEVLDIKPELKQKWAQRAAQNTTSALNALNEIEKSYTKPQESDKKHTNNELKIAADKMQLMIMLQMKKNQKGMAA